ncbi:hypothetical protein Daus18300_001801 [Diaporthe australafricana]|uniref:Aminoglycoside phosphotransferase domain-containing protein n=1 Tax=Diaporthe australafricana TaxID=127596 RepID=A0ABR3XUJ5_9PEZI
MSSGSAPDASDSEDETNFGRLLNITAAELTALASRIRDMVFKTETVDGRQVKICMGSFNVVHILQLDEFMMVIRIPTTGQSGDLRDAAKEAFESQVQTLNYIRKHTSVPVPQVYHFDTTADNEIHAPYIAMGYVSGRTVSNLWFDASGPTPLEHRRRNILKQLAKAMSQLQELPFNKIGSLLLGSRGGIHDLGPCYDWDEAENGTSTITSSGPFSTIDSFLKSSWAPTNTKSVYAIGATKVLEEMLPFLPQTSEYVLALPDYDSQNVMADEEGNLTGIIDWDNAQTVPSFMGCLRYPGWITRDWDPLMYGWPMEGEDSPDDLQRYRAYYLDEMMQVLKLKGSSDYRITEKSHVFEAFWIAASSEPNRTSICRKFVEEAKCGLKGEELSDGLGQDALGILYEIAHGELDDEDWKKLRKGLEALMSQEQ